MRSRTSGTVVETASSPLESKQNGNGKSSTDEVKFKGNPKDSMKSTWRRLPKRDWGFAHWGFEILGIHPSVLDKDVPVHPKTDKVPYSPEWSGHRWVLIHSLPPIFLHHLYVQYTGQNFTPFQAFIFYAIFFKLIAIHELRGLRFLGHVHGFLDGDQHERDGVPDVAVGKVLQSLLSTSTARPIFTVFFAYRTAMAPDTMAWKWLPLEIGLYGIILDFWFYWYHRLMHEVSSLWQYHRTHHLTKHPNPLLTLYADTEQELFDIAGIPLMAFFTMKFMGLPMGFYEWWVCHQYVMFSELAGHSGLRICATPPSTLNWLLRYFKCELVIEDHDIHHRKGWKHSGNYGKQTRLWDRIFGTLKDREETTMDNVDYQKTAPMPLFWW